MKIIEKEGQDIVQYDVDDQGNKTERKVLSNKELFEIVKERYKLKRDGELAELLCVSYPTIARWKSGEDMKCLPQNHILALLEIAGLKDQISTLKTLIAHNEDDKDV